MLDRVADILFLFAAGRRSFQEGFLIAAHLNSQALVVGKGSLSCNSYPYLEVRGEQAPNRETDRLLLRRAVERHLEAEVVDRLFDLEEGWVWEGRKGSREEPRA